MSFSWEGFETAWVLALAGALGVPVVWTHQDGPWLQYPWATVQVITQVELGTGGEQYCRTTLTPGSSWGDESWGEGDWGGQQFAVEVQQVSRLALTVSVNVYSDSAQVIGDQSPMAIVQRGRQRLRLPTQKAILCEAGIGLFDLGQAQNLTGLLDSEHEGRAQLDLRCYVTTTEVELIGWIERVSGQAIINGASSAWEASP